MTDKKKPEPTIATPPLYAIGAGLICIAALWFFFSMIAGVLGAIIWISGLFLGVMADRDRIPGWAKDQIGIPETPDYLKRIPRDLRPFAQEHLTEAALREVAKHPDPARTVRLLKETHERAQAQKEVTTT